MRQVHHRVQSYRPGHRSLAGPGGLAPAAFPHLRGSTGHHLGAVLSRRIHQDSSRLADPGRNTPGLTSLSQTRSGDIPPHGAEPYSRVGRTRSLWEPSPWTTAHPPGHPALPGRRCPDALPAVWTNHRREARQPGGLLRASRVGQMALRGTHPGLLTAPICLVGPSGARPAQPEAGPMPSKRRN